jgi:putative effector of murein hydrolase
VALSLLITEEITTACILLSVFIAIYTAGAFAIKKRRPLFFRPLLIAAAILLVIVLEKII